MLKTIFWITFSIYNGFSLSMEFRNYDKTEIPGIIIKFLAACFMYACIVKLF